MILSTFKTLGFGLLLATSATAFANPRPYAYPIGALSEQSMGSEAAGLQSFSSMKSELGRLKSGWESKMGKLKTGEEKASVSTPILTLLREGHFRQCLLAP